MFSGEKLKNIREEKGYSQAEVAKLLNISKVSYFNWENGKTKPNQKNLNLLSQLLGVEETYFVSEYDIVDTYFKLNQDNRRKLDNYADDLLKEQEKIVQLPKYYAYKVFEKLSAGTGYSYFGDGNYDTVFYDKQLDMTLLHGSLGIQWNPLI